MTAKTYLRQAYRLNELINSHTAELEGLRKLSVSLPGTDYSQERVQGGQTEDRIGGIVAKIVDLEAQINCEIDDLVKLKKEIHNVIEEVENPNERLILRYRYIETLNWEQTAQKTSYSIMQAQRIHSQALKHLKIKRCCEML